ncbi:MAG: hypothetical protein R3D25_23730, partial [Geminicoccaceae bacterium]
MRSTPPTPGELTLEINRHLLAGGLAVTDPETAAAMRAAFRELEIVVEPGGARRPRRLPHRQARLPGQNDPRRPLRRQRRPGTLCTGAAGGDIRET